MNGQQRFSGRSPWRTLALIGLLASGLNASAAVTTTGCSSQSFCTGTELSAGGEFTIDGVRFSDFVSVGIFGEQAVRYTPYNDNLSPGFHVTRDGGLPLYRAAGVPVDPTDGVVFDVESLDNRAILRRTIGAQIGEYADPVTAYIGVRTYDVGAGTVDLTAVCYEPLVCANSTLSDTALYPVAGLVAIDDYSLDLVAFIGDESDPTNAVVELQAAAFRIVVEPSDNVDVFIMSGSDWLSSDTEQAGWQTVAFDDTAWVPARAPYPSPITPEDLIPATPAEFMWFDPDMTSNGGTGAVRSWYRFPFSIDLPGGASPVSAVVKSSVDDDYDLYVNGTLVLANHDNGFGNNVDTTDIASYLQDGDNLIAIYAVDGGWDDPRERGFERVLVDARLTLPRFSLPIRSDATWLSSDSGPAGWQNVGFDDSAWANARSPYPSPILPAALMQDTAAQFVWHDPTMGSDGTSGPVEAFFRFNFILPFEPASVPIFAHAKVNADDDYDLYVNGTLVYQNNDGGFADIVDEIDFASALRQGANVIAVRAADGSGGNPYERGYERLLFEGLVATGDTWFANDVDGDELNDFEDNCIYAYNPAQTDSDDDLYGNACDADLNNDGVINPVDLGLIRQVFFGSDADADMNVDGEVNNVDLGIMKSLFFGPPGPSAIAP